MKKSNHAAIFLSFAVLTAFIFIAGCQEQNAISNAISIDPTNIRQARLVAAENINLQKQIAKCEMETEKQRSLLEKCELKAVKERQRGEKLTEFLFQETIKLTEENKKLKAMIK